MTNFQTLKLIDIVIDSTLRLLIHRCIPSQPGVNKVSNLEKASEWLQMLKKS